MAREAQVTFTGQVHVLFVGSVVDTVTRKAVHELAVTRIPRLFAHGMARVVLVVVASVAEGHWIGGQKKRLVAAVRGMARRAVHRALGMTRVPPSLTRG